MSDKPVRITTKVQKRKTHSNSPLAQSTSATTHAHQTTELIRKRHLIKRVNYANTVTTVALPLIAIAYIFHNRQGIIPKNVTTLYFTCIYYNITMLCFTSGYHKYFAHNSFKINYSWLVKLFLIFGSSVGLGCAKWWAGLHRAHHHFVDDVEKDPYSIKRGFWFAHWGWVLWKPKNVVWFTEFIESEFGSDVDHEEDEDENENEKGNTFARHDDEHRDLLIWQEKTYLVWFAITTFIIPVFVTMFICNDTAINGIIYPGILRMFLCQQSMLTPESICHTKRIQVTIPSQPFNDTNSSIDSQNPLISFLTYGQSQHNYHHEFPHDYRTHNSHFTYDPTKWFLVALDKLNLITNLSCTPTNLIIQLQIQQQQRYLNRIKSQLNWGTPISKLPKITPRDFKRIVNSPQNADRIYIVIQNIIHDITPFMDQHPGGVALLKASHGKDATKAFYGGVYGHSTAAQNLLATMRIGVLDDGNEEEVWRRVAREEGESGERRAAAVVSGQYRTAEAA